MIVVNTGPEVIFVYIHSSPLMNRSYNAGTEPFRSLGAVVRVAEGDRFPCPGPQFAEGT